MRSIRARLLAGTAIGVSLAFAISGVLVIVLARSSLAAQADDALVARARSLAALVEQDRDTLEVELDPAGTPGDRTYFELWDGEHVLMRSTSLGGADLTRAPGELAFSDVALPGGDDGRQVTLRFAARREPEEGPAAGPGRIVTLALARSTADVSDAVGRVAKVLIGAGVIGTLLCLAILAGVVRLGLRPVRSLAAAIAELREGDLAVKLDTAPPAELGPVVDRLDALLRRLAAAFARERELTAEIAHELRTPLAGLRATLEVAASRDDRPAESYRTAIANCLAITRDTERIVGAMLNLARLDAGSAPAVAAEAVDLDELVRDILAPLAPRAADRKVTVITKLEPVTVTTDRDKLRVVIGNLLDNAISYVEDGGEIVIRLADRRLEVENTGCALEPADAAHVFERFWRGDTARAAGTHAGLGLALSRKLVDLLGGTIAARVEGNRFIAEVTL